MCQEMDCEPKFLRILKKKHMNLWFGRGEKTVPTHYDNNEGIMGKRR